MTNPKQMNANYRKNERLLEKNPTPIDIGLSEDVKAYVDEHSGGNYTAGTGIEITEENVINNSAPVPAFTTSEDEKILGVTVDSSGETPVAQVGWVDKSLAGFSFEKTLQIKNTSALSAGSSTTYYIDSTEFDSSYDYIVFATSTKDIDISGTFFIHPTTNKYGITVANMSKNDIPSSQNGFITLKKFKRPKEGETSVIVLVGSVYVGGAYNMYYPKELPTTTGNAGKVLAVNSGATGVEWTTLASGGVSAHTYNNFGELRNDIAAHPNSILIGPTKGSVYTKQTYQVYYNSTYGCSITETEIEIGSTSGIMCNLYYHKYTIPADDSSTSITMNGYKTELVNTVITDCTKVASTLSVSISNLVLFY